MEIHSAGCPLEQKIFLARHVELPRVLRNGRRRVISVAGSQTETSEIAEKVAKVQGYSACRTSAYVDVESPSLLVQVTRPSGEYINIYSLQGYWLLAADRNVQHSFQSMREFSLSYFSHSAVTAPPFYVAMNFERQPRVTWIIYFTHFTFWALPYLKFSKPVFVEASPVWFSCCGSSWWCLCHCREDDTLVVSIVPRTCLW